MSTVSTPSVAGTTQIWGASKTGDEHMEDGEEVTSRRSSYVDVFQNMHDIVMEQEKALFSSEELACFQRLNAMSYPARYLFIRLSLRKRGKWHSLSDLEQRYKIEIGGREQISNIIDELCATARTASVKTTDEEPHIIDLTQDENMDLEMSLASKILDPVDHMKANVSASRSAPHQNSPHEVYIFAEDDSNASLPELLDCLTHDELKNIGKQLKVTKTGQTRSSLSKAIISNASNQTTLTFPILTSCDKIANAKQKQPLNFTSYSRLNQATLVRRLVMDSIGGRCIRISHTILSLFDRLNIVFFRSTVYGAPLALPALLTAFRKRRHVDISYVRTCGIFSSRQALLDYEEALALEGRIDEALSGQTPMVDSPPASSYRSAQRKGKAKEKESLSNISPRIEAAKVVREIWIEIYDRWKVLVNVTGDQERSPGLERFDCDYNIGHVLTRIMYKGAEALAILKEFDLEMEILRALLAQTKWRRGCRGAWYNRLALVLMTHTQKTQENLEMAMDVVMNGLRDSLTHLTYRPRLERRLTRLEKMLDTPVSERHRCDGQLRKAQDIYIEGVRVKNKACPSIWDKSGKGGKVSSTSTQPPVREANEDITQNAQPWKGKTLWITKDKEEVTVEQFALEYYGELGFKGFHSEGRIVSTIFGLLFWDVIFAPVPGAFETPYQSAPLDIFEDTFYLARQGLIDQRLAVLERSEARVLLEQVLSRERQHRTSCIGVDWDFQPDELLDIVDCLGGHALAIICRMICEDYGQWQSGVPDLLVWNVTTRECRFVEVKSSNDRLQENQKVWIDVLLSSETLVDLCHVVEKGERRKGKREYQVSSRTTNPGTVSNTELQEGLRLGGDETDQLHDQHLTKKHDRDPHDLVHALAKKRKVHEPAGTSRRTQKSSRVTTLTGGEIEDLI